MSGENGDWEVTAVPYELIRSGRRSVSIEVRRDGRVVVRAPRRMPAGDVEAVLRRKAAWIDRKRRKFAALPPLPQPQYVSGETHFLLGRPLRLTVARAERRGVVLNGDELVLRVRKGDDAERRGRTLTEWYRRQARDVFAGRLAACFPLAAPYGVARPQLKVRKMRRRWGSCSSTGTITLAIRLVQAPQDSIDYVLVHELAHLVEHNHSKRFYDLMDVLLPDWRARRDALNRLAIA